LKLLKYVFGCDKSSPSDKIDKTDKTETKNSKAKNGDKRKKILEEGDALTSGISPKKDKKKDKNKDESEIKGHKKKRDAKSESKNEEEVVQAEENNSKEAFEEGVTTKDSQNGDTSVTQQNKKIKYKKDEDELGGKRRFPTRISIVNKILRKAEKLNQNALKKNLEKRANNKKVIKLVENLEIKKKKHYEIIMRKRLEDEIRAKKTQEQRNAQESAKQKRLEAQEEVAQKSRLEFKQKSEFELPLKKKS
jgi:hypothetical protein